MEIRTFQIIIPLLAVVFILGRITRIQKQQSTWRETIPIILFWMSMVVLAWFPDVVSNRIASALGFKSNVNAVIFFGMGVLFYFQYQLFLQNRKLNKSLTELVRKQALVKATKEET